MNSRNEGEAKIFNFYSLKLTCLDEDEFYINQLSNETLNKIEEKFQLDFDLFGYNLSNWRRKERREDGENI